MIAFLGVVVFLVIIIGLGSWMSIAGLWLIMALAVLGWIWASISVQMESGSRFFPSVGTAVREVAPMAGWVCFFGVCVFLYILFG